MNYINVEIADIEARMETFDKDIATAEDFMDCKEDLNHLRYIENLWKSFLKVPVYEDSKVLALEWNDFPKYTPEETVSNWFKSHFILDFPHDVYGDHLTIPEWKNLGDVNFLEYGGCLVRKSWSEKEIKESPDRSYDYDVFYLDPEIEQEGKSYAALCKVTINDPWIEKQDILYAIGMEDKQKLPMDEIMSREMWAKEIVSFYRPSNFSPITLASNYPSCYEDFICGNDEVRMWLDSLGALHVIEMQQKRMQEKAERIKTANENPCYAVIFQTIHEWDIAGLDVFLSYEEAVDYLKRDAENAYQDELESAPDAELTVDEDHAELTACGGEYNWTWDIIRLPISTNKQKTTDTNQSAEPPCVAVVIDEGLISEVLSSDPKISVDIIEMDSDYTSSDQAEEAYVSLHENKRLRDCDYTYTLVGREEE